MGIALKVFSILLLLFNGVGALYGSWHLITDPSGESIQMPIALLQHSPFNSFLIPGIVLLFANGLLSFAVIALILLKSRIYPLAIVAEGCILFGWISIQVMMLRTLEELHIALWTVAVLLIVAGFLLQRAERNS